MNHYEKMRHSIMLKAHRDAAVGKRNNSYQREDFRTSYDHWYQWERQRLAPPAKEPQAKA